MKNAPFVTIEGRVSFKNSRLFGKGVLGRNIKKKKRKKKATSTE
jgi:hypothetical protein